jgi:hypothetical protein
MHQGTKRFAFAALLIVTLLGCQSHEAKVDSLQSEYNQLGQQYRKDCFAEVTEVAPKPSPKCADEKRKLDDAWKRLQAEQAKKITTEKTR